MQKIQHKEGDNVDSCSLDENIQILKAGVGPKNSVVIRHFYIGIDEPLDAAIVYVNAMADKTIIDRDVLNPLMLHVNENLTGKPEVLDYISKRFISMSNTKVEKDIFSMIDSIKRGKTVLLVNGAEDGIILDTTGGNYRAVMEPENESSIRGKREGFVENLETNISMIKRSVKDNNLTIEIITVGRRSQSDIALIYVDNIADNNVLEEIKSRINALDIRGPFSAGELDQLIEGNTYTVFPQGYSTERVDVATANMMEGRIIIMVEGYSVVLVVPSQFVEFFQAVEDYNQKTIGASFVRLLRFFAAFTVISLPAIYLTLLKFNSELIPIKFISPIVQSRVGIALTPFLEILSMEIVVELLREGGLRLPSKVAQTLSLVGGIIIGDTAVKSKVVSPTTLLVVGITVVCTFLIPNYDMSLAIRILRFPMLMLADVMGIFGIAVGWFLIIVHLASLNSFGVPYFEIHSSDLKDFFIRAPLWKMNKTPASIPTPDNIRQKDTGGSWRNKNE